MQEEQTRSGVPATIDSAEESERFHSLIGEIVLYHWCAHNRPGRFSAT